MKLEKIMRILDNHGVIYVMSENRLFAIEGSTASNEDMWTEITDCDMKQLKDFLGY